MSCFNLFKLNLRIYNQIKDRTENKVLRVLMYIWYYPRTRHFACVKNKKVTIRTEYCNINCLLMMILSCD